MDNDRATTVRVIKDFQGLYSDFSPEDMPNGATAEQVNLFSLQTGSLIPRMGIKVIQLTRLE